MDTWAIVATIGIIAWAVVRTRGEPGTKRRRGRHAKDRRDGLETTSDHDRQRDAVIQDLKSRIEVLERIVTDRGYDVRNEFRKL